MIQLKRIQFRHPQSDFDLFINDLKFTEGSKIAIIGPSGFGKTTMLNLIAGILLPDKGEVIVNKVILNSQSDKNLYFHHLRLT